MTDEPSTSGPDYDMHWRTPLQGGPCPICGDTTMSRQYGSFEPNPSRYVTHANGRTCPFPPGWMYTPPDGTWHWRGGEPNPLTPLRADLYAIIPTYASGNLRRQETELFTTLEEALTERAEYESYSTKQKYRLFRLEEIPRDGT